MRKAQIFLCLLLFAHSSYAQKYLFARYMPKDGLINNRTRFLYQDSRGRLYISTFGGLSVYDGSRFLNYTTDNGLVTSLVNDIVEMGDDSLWVIPNGRAIHCLVRGRLKEIHTADNYVPVINQMVRGSDGFLYAISDFGLFRFERNRFVPISLRDNAGRMVDGPLVQAVECNGRLIILTDPWSGALPGAATLVVYNLRTHHTTIPPKKLDDYFLANAPGNQALVATSAGVYSIDSTMLRQDSIRLLPPPAPWQAAGKIVSRFCYFDRHQNLWITTERGVTRLDAVTGGLQEFTTANGLPPGLIAGVLQDKEDNLWIANDRNGVAKIPSREAAYFAHPAPGFTVTEMGSVAGTDTLWFYDVEKRNILLMQDSTVELYRPEGPVPDRSHVSIGRTSAWMSSEFDLYKLQFLPGHRYRVIPAWHDPSFRFGIGCFDKKGNLILVGEKITLIPAGQTLPIHQPSQFRLPYLCDQAAIDAQGRIWTVTRGDDIRTFGITGTGAGARLELLAYTKSISGSSARSITADNRGNIYIGTRDHGLYCLFFDGLRHVSTTHLTTQNGLSENFIDYLLCDDDNTVWACTPAGLDRIRLDSSRITIDKLTYSHDNYQSVYKVCATRDGNHWALASEGYMKIGVLPAKRTDYLPRILFSEVLVGNTPNADTNQKTLTLPYDRNTITFHIGVTSFIDETQTRYSYLLEGSSNKNWSPFTAESAIHFVSLPPGQYTLQVRARFIAGDYPDLTSAYPFRILPPWWQTWWFRIALAVTLATLLVLVFRAYIRRRLLHQRQELENQQAIERERTRIATDMHDELGAGLSRIKFLSETIGIKKQQQLPIEEEITGIRRYSHEMIDKMGEIVWALNERNDSLSDLLSYTRSYAAEYLLQAGIRCQVEAPAELPTCFVSGEFRRNIYLTIKETLHNVVKHAQAESVNIRMTVQPGNLLVITIEDDGVGFNRDHIRPFANGLNNMHRRIGDLGGTLYIYTGSGTTIRLSVPL